jgi:hypothetical protein
MHSRSTLKIIALLGCLVMLTGWRVGPPLTFFEEEGAIARAVETLRAKGGFERVLSIDIGGGSVTIEAQDPFNNRHVNRWTLTREHFYSLNWDETNGPEPVALNLINPDLDSNLFDIKQVDFSAAESLMTEALAQAALEDSASIERMRIERQIFLLPKSASGDVRWSVGVRSDREHARVLADAKGRVVGLDLAGTNRARTFNLLASLEKVPKAAHAFAEAVGAEPVLVEVRIASHGMSFETNIQEKSGLLASLKQRQTFSWNLNGLTRNMGSIDTSAYFGADPAFSIWDVDWSAAGKLVAEAKEQLQMPDGVVDDIEIEKPGDVPGAPKVEWQIALKDANGEKGTARFDAKSGEVLGLELPESRRKPFDARDPAHWPSLLAAIEKTFGADGSIAELLINENQVSIEAADPQNPEQLAQFLLDDEGIKRFGTASPFAAGNPRFTVAEIRSLTGDQMRKLQDQTAARLGMPPPKIVNITIGKASMDPSPRGTVTVEIRAEDATLKRGGRVNWEIDGREIKAYLP